MSERLFEIVKWLTPVAIFFLGFILQALFRRFGDCQSRKLRRELILISVESLILRGEKQIAEIHSVIRNLKDINNTEILVPHVTGDEFYYMKENSSVDHFEIFVQKRKGKRHNRLSEFRSFRNSVAFIEELFPAIFSMNKESFDRVMEHYNSFNDRYFETVRCVNEFVNEHNRRDDKKIQDTLVDECTSILKSIYETHGPIINNIDIIHKEGILKLKDVCKKHKSDSRSIRMFGIIQQAEALYLRIEVDRNQEIKHLTSKASQLQESIDTLMTVLNKFENSSYRF